MLAISCELTEMRSSKPTSGSGVWFRTVAFPFYGECDSSLLYILDSIIIDDIRSLSLDDIGTATLLTMHA